MEKYIAFGLYRKNPLGGHQEISKRREGEHVYLASDVEALLKKLSGARLDWGMTCDCECKGCDALDAALRDLMAG